MILWVGGGYYIGIALIAGLFLIVMLCVCLRFSFMGLKNHGLDLMRQGKRHDIIMVIGMVQNGLAMYLTWATVISTVNLAAYLYNHGVTTATAAAVSLTILTLAIIAYAVLDFHFLETYFRFIFTPYLVLIGAFIGILAENWTSYRATSYVIAVLLALVVVMTLLKITSTTIRQLQNPIYSKIEKTYEMVKSNYKYNESNL